MGKELPEATKLGDADGAGFSKGEGKSVSA